uniref:Peroxin-19 n=1 Tax=Timema tahoe TaxID=61484 RepID=A0A7R9IPQ0_9NEOP|nr:unnamed protein product [Timema tahoe]
MNMFSELGVGDGSGGSEDLIPMMNSIMQSLLSKDVLYPALKDLSDKYPSWLEEKASQLSSTDLERYTKQKVIMLQICKEFEKENKDDSSDTKKHRFENIMKLMTQDVACGFHMCCNGCYHKDLLCCEMYVLNFFWTVIVVPGECPGSGEWKTTVSTPEQDLKLDLPIIGSLVYCESMVLGNAATDVFNEQNGCSNKQSITLYKLSSKGDQDTLLLQHMAGKEP